MREFKIHITYFSQPQLQPRSPPSALQTFQSLHLHISVPPSEVIHKVVLSQAVGFSFSVQAQKQMHLRFILSQKSKGRAFEIGEGNVRLKESDLRKGEIKTQCQLSSLDSQEVVLEVSLSIVEELENVGYSQNDSISNSNVIQPETPPKEEEDKQPQPPKAKNSSYFGAKKRRQGFKMCKTDKNVTILNQVHNDSNNILENIKFDFDQGVSSIQITDREGFIATVNFQTNPSQDDLKKIQVKVPDKCSHLSLEILKMDGNKYFCTLPLPKLQESESLRLSSVVENGIAQPKGRISFNYKSVEEVEQVKFSSSKLPIASEEPTAMRNSAAAQSWKNFLFAHTNSPVKINKNTKVSAQWKDKNYLSDDAEFSLPRIYTHAIETGRKSSQLRKSSVSKGSRKSSDSKKKGKKLVRLKTLGHEDEGNEVTTRAKDKVYQILQVKEVFISFDPSLFPKDNRESFRGKFLRIITNSRGKYQSINAFGNTHLNWVLDDCQIPINQFDNFFCELVYDRERLVIGQVIVSYNQLKFNYQNKTFYTGYIFKESMPIAKVSMDYSLLQQPQLRIDARREQSEVHQQRSVSINRRQTQMLELGVINEVEGPRRRLQSESKIDTRAQQVRSPRRKKKFDI